MRDEKLDSINIIKVVLCFVVTQQLHYHQHFLTGFVKHTSYLYQPYLDYILKHSNPMGELIFMMSGVFFAVAYRNRIIGGKSTFGDFMVKRFIRIWPMVMIALTYLYFIQFRVYDLMGYCYSWTGTTNIWVYLGDLLYVRGFWMGTAEFGTMPMNGSTWQLYILMVCYAVAFILCQIEGYIQKKKPGAKTIWIHAIPIVIGTVLFLLKLNLPVLTENWARGYSFFIGIYVYELMKWSNGLNKKKRYILLAATAVLYVGVMLAGDTMWDLWGINESLVYTYVASPALMLFLYNSSLAVKIGQWKPVAYLGDLTFDLFTWNFPIMGTFYYLINAGVIRLYGYEIPVWILMWLTHLVVASLSHELIEKRLGNWIQKKWSLRGIKPKKIDKQTGR